MKEIDVVGAVIVRDGAVLCVQRSASGNQAGLWEFPGGKIEEGETPREALVREIREELLCTVGVGAEVTTTRHEHDFGSVTLSTFYCMLELGTPQLTEHQAMMWLNPGDLETLEWTPADVPTVEILKRELTNYR